MLTMQESFLESIIENPADDAPRLIYADWLEENGQEERAEFIRVQIELARHPQQVQWLAHMPVEQWSGSAEEGELLRNLDCLRRRERELWFINTFADFTAWMDEWWFTRGFVSRVRLTCAAWMEHGPIIVQRNPLERVELSDKLPTEYEHGSNGKPYWRWFEHDSQYLDPDELPLSLFSAIYFRPMDEWRYPSKEAALDVLSTVCLAWARAQHRNERD